VRSGTSIVEERLTFKFLLEAVPLKISEGAPILIRWLVLLFGEDVYPRLAATSQRSSMMARIALG
jgi:hypothetical protein